MPIDRIRPIASRRRFAHRTPCSTPVRTWEIVRPALFDTHDLQGLAPPNRIAMSATTRTPLVPLERVSEVQRLICTTRPSTNI